MKNLVITAALAMLMACSCAVPEETPEIQPSSEPVSTVPAPPVAEVAPDSTGTAAPSPPTAEPKEATPVAITPEQEDHIIRNIKLLSSEDFNERENATNDLMSAGEAALKYLERAALGGSDPEAAARATMIKETIILLRTIKFSNALVKSYPSIYVEYASGDRARRFEIFEKVSAIVINNTAHNRNKTVFPLTVEDYATFMADLLSDGGVGLSSQQKRRLCLEACGQSEFFDPVQNTRWSYSGIHPAVSSAAPSILKLLNDPDISVQTEAIKAIGQIGKAPDVKDELLKLFALTSAEQQGDWAIKGALIQALIKLKVTEATPEISAILTSNKNSLSYDILNAISSSNAIEYAPVLRKMIDESTPGYMISLVARSLAQFKDYESIPEIAAMLESPLIDDVYSISNALIMFGADKAGEETAKYLKSEFPTARVWAVVTLANMGAGSRINPEALAEAKELYLKGISQNDNLFYQIKNAFTKLGMSLEPASPPAPGPGIPVPPAPPIPKRD